MSWISDVKYELKKLDVSFKSLKKFGLTIGSVLILIALVLIYFNLYPTLKIIFFIVGISLILFGLIIPSKLLTVYKFWMGIAFVLGWFVSRLLLSILFIVVLTPIGIIAKLVGKKFLNLSYNKSNSSHWVKVNKSEERNYEKMY